MTLNYRWQSGRGLVVWISWEINKFQQVKCEMFFSGFIRSSFNRAGVLYSSYVLSVMFWCICASLSRCVGQHGEVQRSGSVQLQHADSVRPREGFVRWSTGGVVRPGPQWHQQTATATGNTHKRTHTHAHTHTRTNFKGFIFYHLRAFKLTFTKVQYGKEGSISTKSNYIHNTVWLTVAANTHAF